MIQISRKFDGGFNLLVVSLIGLLAGSLLGTADAQIVVRNRVIIGGQQEGDRIVIGGRDVDVAQALMALQRVNGASDQGDVEEVNLATLRTDPELESILEKAKRFQDDGNYRVATKLMQAVLELSLIHISEPTRPY